MKKLIPILLVLFIVKTPFAQSDYFFEEDFSGKEIGINMTPILTQLIPFQNSSVVTGPYNIVFRPGKNNRFFNLKFGVWT